MPGTPSGVTLCVVVLELLPAIVRDCTSTVAAVPLDTFAVRVKFDAAAVSVSTHVLEPCTIVTMYAESSAPPVFTGASHVTLIERSPAVAVNAGASGSPSGVAEPTTPLPVVPEAFLADTRRNVCVPFTRLITVNAVAVSDVRTVSLSDTGIHELASVDRSMT